MQEYIISADWLIPMQEANPFGTNQSSSTSNEQTQFLQNQAIRVKGNLISEILDSKLAQQKYPELPFTHLAGQVLLPGFVNAHCHAAMNLLRGLSDDKPLMEWLENEIWPVEAQFVDDAFVYEGCQHAIAEMLRSGTTCFQDMYFMPNQVAKAVHESGIRCNLGLVIVDFETSWAKNAQDCIEKGLDVYDDFKHSNTLCFNLAPHAPYTVSKSTLEKIAMLSHELSLNVQIHLHETAHEVDSFIENHGIRPMSMMRDLGLLSPQLNAVHMTQLNQGEIEWLAESGTHVIHCPQSNMKLSSGICPTKQLLQAGVNIAIGTDGAASNNDLDMINEMRSASLLAKVDFLDPTALNAYETLYAATMGGAKALGLDDKIGSLESGKCADFIAIDLNTIETMPVYNPISQIVYSSSRNQVTNAWVNGKQLLKDRQLATLNTQQIMHNVAQWHSKISQR
ncbi:TRZ/ATZ family hydrolase [Aliikangiella sp. IMCC44632]